MTISYFLLNKVSLYIYIYLLAHMVKKKHLSVFFWGGGDKRRQPPPLSKDKLCLIFRYICYEHVFGDCLYVVNK